jgi:hypothetical protein
VPGNHELLTVIETGKIFHCWQHRARVRHRLAGPVGRRAESSIARTRLEDEIVEARIVKTKIHQPDGVH